MNAKTLSATLALLVLVPATLAQTRVPAAPPAPARPPVNAATRTPAEQTALTRGRALMTEFLALKLTRLWNTFTPDVQGQWGSLDGFTAFRKTGIEQYGLERSVVREQTFVQGKEVVYVRSSIYEKFPNQVWAFAVGFTGTQVTTFGVLLQDERTDDPVALGH